jgi:outer membrane protein assembly factor BamB
MRRLILLFLTLVLTGCAGFKQLDEVTKELSAYILGGEDNTEPPNELVVYEQEIKIELLWKEQTGVGSDGQDVKLVPAVAYGKVITADREGLVEAREASTGKLLWSVEKELPLSGGPGIGLDTVILGTSNAEVLALNINSGEELWKVKVSSEVLSVPRIEQRVVIVRTTDGREIALSESDGEEIWTFVKSVPALSIRGSGTPVIDDGNVITGYANGKMIALQLEDGKLVWETSIAIPKGRSEVERLVDLDVDPIISDGVIFIASYQGGVSGVLAFDGDVLWRNEEVSSFSGLSNDWKYIYLSDSESDVWQLDQRMGAALWRQKDLHQRRLTAPAAYEDFVAVGDFEGFVHWLAVSDGRQLGRIQITDEPIQAQPVVVDNIVYVYAADGTLAALKARLF